MRVSMDHSLNAVGGKPLPHRFLVNVHNVFGFIARSIDTHRAQLPCELSPFIQRLRHHVRLPCGIMDKAPNC